MNALAVVAHDFGGDVLPDNRDWTNRIEIRSATSSRLYVVAQRKSTREWACSCPGWKRWHGQGGTCKHLNTMVPALAAAQRARIIQ